MLREFFMSKKVNLPWQNGECFKKIKCYNSRLALHD
jgi:hypothetical protein